MDLQEHRQKKKAAVVCSYEIDTKEMETCFTCKHGKQR